MLFGASNPYPPFHLGGFWPLFCIGLFVGAIGGYYLWRWARRWLALKKQHRLIELQKANKPQVIAHALQEITRIRQAVEADSLLVDAGAAQISLVTRSAFDTLMNHRTSYAAKYEVAARQLGEVEAMLANAYPVMFSEASNKDKAAFGTLCGAAVKVVESCR